MTTGDINDIIFRLLDDLPTDWFGSNHPLLDAVLRGTATPTVFNFQQIQYAALQTRLQTATDINLDLIAQDYFGNGLPRLPDENDATYRLRIEANVLRPRATRQAMIESLELFTGYRPTVFEFWYPLDIGGGYDVPTSAFAYDTIGLWGEWQTYFGRYQAMIDVYMSKYQALGMYSGYENPYGAYDTVLPNAQLWYGDEILITTNPSDQSVYDLINNTKVFGTICWVRINRI